MHRNEEQKSKDDIMDLAKKLGQALSCSNELHEFREAERIMASDTEASRLIKSFKNKQSGFKSKQNDDTCNSNELQKYLNELQDLGKEMKNHPLIDSYYKKGQEFNNLIYQINQILRFFTMDKDESEQFSNSKCKGCSKCSD